MKKVMQVLWRQQKDVPEIHRETLFYDMKELQAVKSIERLDFINKGIEHTENCIEDDECLDYGEDIYILKNKPACCLVSDVISYIPYQNIAPFMEDYFSVHKSNIVVPPEGKIVIY
jgi:hypothetical protein